MSGAVLMKPGCRQAAAIQAHFIPALATTADALAEIDSSSSAANESRQELKVTCVWRSDSQHTYIRAQWGPGC